MGLAHRNLPASFRLVGSVEAFTGLIDVLGIRAAIQGSISLASAPDDVLVEAEGRFLALRPEQASRLFGDISGDEP